MSAAESACPGCPFGAGKHPNAEAQVEAIARRVAELIDRPPRLVDVATLAELLSVSAATIYRLSDELGAVRVGGALRFDPAQAIANLRATERDSSERSQQGDEPSTKRRARRRTADKSGSENERLPLRRPEVPRA